VHFQDVNKARWNGKGDYIARLDYDGNFVMKDNWDHLLSFSTPSTAYFAVSEGDTHWFIYYFFYHPRDWAASSGQEHENDAEGALMFVRKDGSEFGSLEGLITMAHGHLYPYRAISFLKKGPSSPRALNDVSFEIVPGETSARPQTYMEPQGHGMFACGTHVRNCVRADDGIKYIPNASTAQIPPDRIKDGVQVPIAYRLVDFTAPGELWERRFDTNVFVDGNNLNGDSSGDCGSGALRTCKTNAANAIWSFDDGDDGLPGASFGTDPAAIVRGYFAFGFATPPSSTYVRNTFACGHNICNEGAPLASTCATSVSDVCAFDDFCCSSFWDATCVAEVSTIAGLTCP
jgi:hypothetical protein